MEKEKQRSVGEIDRRDVEIEIADRVGGTILHTGEIADSTDGSVTAQINDNDMWERDIVDGTPEGAFLQVESLVGGVVAMQFLTVGISNRPSLAGDEISVGVEEVEFGESRDRRVGAMSGGNFQSDEATGDGSGEVDLLPAVAGSKGSREGGREPLEGERLSRLAMERVADELEFVENRLGKTLGYRVARAEDVEHHNFVLALPEPATGHVESLLRADFPETAEGMTVDPDEAFTPGGEIEESVGGPGDIERSTVDTDGEAGVERVGGKSAEGEILEPIKKFSVIGNGDHFPVLEIMDEGETIAVDSDGDIVGDAFVVLYGAAEIDASHGFNKDVEAGTFGGGREPEGALAKTTIERTDEAAIDKHLSEIVGLIDRQGGTTIGDGRERGGIEDGTETLVERLHRHNVARRDRSREIGEKRSHFRESKRLHGNRLYDGRHRRKSGPIGRISGKSGAKIPVLWRGLAAFGNRGVVVVGSDIGGKSGRIGARPVPPVSSTVSHIERERNALGEHGVDTGNHIGSRASLMVCAPLVEPTAPKLAAHERGGGANVTEVGKLAVNVGASAEIHSPEEVVEAIEGEIGRPVALKQSDVIAEIGTKHITDSGYIFLIDAIGTIFILHLNHDNGPPVGNRQTGDLLGESLLEQVDTLKEIGIVFAEADILLLKEPPGETTHFPFGADVGTGTKNDLHVVGLTKTDKLGYVVLTGEIKLTLDGLVSVPESVKTNRIHAERLTELNALIPVRAGNSGIMKFGGLNDERLAIEEERTISNLKAGTGIAGKSREQREKEEQGGCGQT